MRTKGARIIRAFTHLLRAGFIRYMNGKADFLYFLILKLLCMQKLFLQVIILKKLIMLFSAIPLLFCGCVNNAPESCDIFAMDTYMNIKAYGENADVALNSAENEIYRLERLFSVTDEISEVYQLNHAQDKTATVSNDVKNLLEFSVETGNETNGFLDISVYPLLRLWGFTTNNYKIPTQEEIDVALKYVDFSKIIINENEVTLPQGFEIDFGAVAKGYTSDKIAEILKVNGIQSAIINLGGNVHTLGCKPDGSMWNVAVTNPFSVDETLGTISVSDKAVVTSGDYQRYFTGKDGKNYSHIIDPFTGYPAENELASVTVIGENGTLCDALSTALFVMGKEKAIKFMKTQPDLSYILVEKKGNITISDNISRNFQLTADLPLETEINEN